MENLNKSWEKFIAFCKREGFGEIRIKIQDGVPVCLPLQIIKRINKDGSTTITEIDKVIDLTKDDL